jgi:hypothetical protein
MLKPYLADSRFDIPTAVKVNAEQRESVRPGHYARVAAICRDTKETWMIWVRVSDRLVLPSGACMFYTGESMSGDGPYTLFGAVTFEPKHVYDIALTDQPPQPIAELL